MRNTPGSKPQNDPPPPIFLPTGFPAPSTARPPVNGTLTHLAPGGIISPRLVSAFLFWYGRGGVFLSLRHPFPLHKYATTVLYTAPMPFSDIEKRREASRRHYAKHRDKVIAKAKDASKVARDRTRAYIKAHLEAHPCVDCGETNIIVLEFDHIGEAGTKEFNISDAAREGIGNKRLEAEIAKCEVRCANCHRKKTYERSGWTHKNN